MNYRYTSDESFLETAQGCADYFIDHLPEDKVVYWDLFFGDDSGEPRDSSAAAIAVCGLLELAEIFAGKRETSALPHAQQKISSIP